MPGAGSGGRHEPAGDMCRPAAACGVHAQGTGVSKQQQQQQQQQHHVYMCTHIRKQAETQPTS